jgi:hypothetical protein
MAPKLRLALLGCGRIAQVHWNGIEESARDLIHGPSPASTSICPAQGCFIYKFSSCWGGPWGGGMGPSGGSLIPTHFALILHAI